MRVMGIMALVCTDTFSKNILALQRDNGRFYVTSLNNYFEGTEKFEDMISHPMRFRLEQWYTSNDRPEKYESI